MKLKPEHYVVGGLAVIVAWSAMFKIRLVNKLAAFIPTVEGFEAHPYWDVSRYSWGYGTAAPGATGTITRAQAFAEMVSHFLHDYDLLKPKITQSLTVAQWTALLDFSYNEGVGRAYDISIYINAGDDSILYTHWMKYVYADGVVLQDLIDRRRKEWDLWIS